ncbi:MAG: M23 family metallopeptidase [Bacteroidales bacterium]
MKKSHIRRTVLLGVLSFFFFQYPLSGQNTEVQWQGNYGKPLQVEPLALSGSMGEFRATHFHTGYDFRVGGVVGAPVYAVADGYISTISVSPSGYGHALYVTHPNGTVSLYGHLHEFSPHIASYVKAKQYEEESFLIVLSCESDRFPVRKGQQIGKAGNTGDSGGPHLHFEIRYNAPVGIENDEEKTALFSANLLQHQVYELEDTLPPEFRAVQFYGYRTEQHGIVHTPLVAGFDGRTNRVTVHVPDTFFVAVDAIDRMNHTWSRMAIETWEVFLDNQLVYRYKNTDLPLEKSRYILSHTYFPERAGKGRSLLKTWLEPGNMLRDSLRLYAPTGGLFTLPDAEDHSLRIVVSDAAGNRSTRHFTLRRTGALRALVEKIDEQVPERASLPAWEFNRVFYWDKANRFEAEGLVVDLPEHALYKNIRFRSVRKDAYEWIIHTAEEPLHKMMEVQMQIPEDIPDTLHRKVYVLRQSDKGRDPHKQEVDPRLWRSAGGHSLEGTVSFRTNAFGRFKITLDTLPPTVTASFPEGADIRGRRTIHFIIKDNESGIADYRITVDGKWLLGQYDAKRSRVTCLLDPDVIKKGTRHQLVMTVTDNKGNVTELNTNFLW